MDSYDIAKRCANPSLYCVTGAQSIQGELYIQFFIILYVTLFERYLFKPRYRAQLNSFSTNLKRKAFCW